MSTNVIKQTLLGEPGSQTIKMVVRSNERGPKGDKGDPGPQGPQGLPGQRGADGAIHYRAGTGINISAENIITATGDATAAWGGIQGNIASQTDLQNALNAKQDIMADFTGANGIVGGTSGKVPAPAATDNVNFLKGDGTWSAVITPDGSVTTAKIVDSAVTTAKINDGAVTTGKIADSAVTSAKIAGNAVTTSTINDGAVTSAKIAGNAVTTSTINDGAVTKDKINFTSTVDSNGWTKIPIADNVNLYMTNGKGSVAPGGGSWTTVTLRNKPTDLDLNNTFFSNASARCADAAINASPTVSGSSGSVLCQISNMHNQTITSDIYYDAMIIEITS